MSDLSVHECGAVGDGMTDEVEAFERAFALACEQKRTVILAPGRRYRLSRAVHIPPGVHRGFTLLRGVRFEDHCLVGLPEPDWQD